MPIKIIATDLDGTLMMPDHLTVSPRTVKALKNAHDKGIKIAIATGRTKFLIESVIEQIPFTDYIIYSNGAVAEELHNGKTVYSRYINKETAIKITDFLSGYKTFYEVFSGGQSYMEEGRDSYFKNNGLPQKFLDELIGRINICQSTKDFVRNNNIEKIDLFSIPKNILPEIRAFFTAIDDICVSSSIADDLEITDSSVNKGCALKGIAESINASADEIMAFGDAQNDVEMLKLAGYSFAMQNGTDECKKAAKFIAKSNADDGLAAAVEEYALKY